jgi:hypothetical protein
MIMNKKEMSQERFKAKPEELKVIFRPQCLDCRKNINKDSCEEFKSKPKDYAENQVECPLFVARYEE